MLANRFALIIEDDAHHLVAISSLLRALNIRYKRNTTGAKVLSQIYKMESQPDFILLDLDLPDGDAFAICSALQADPQLKYIPVIAMADNEMIAQMTPQIRDHRFAGAIPKPFSPRTFPGLVSQILNSAQV